MSMQIQGKAVYKYDFPTMDVSWGYDKKTGMVKQHTTENPNPAIQAPQQISGDSFKMDLNANVYGSINVRKIILFGYIFILIVYWF